MRWHPERGTVWRHRARLVAWAVVCVPALAGMAMAWAQTPAPAAVAAQTLVPAQSEVTFVARQLGVPIQGRFQRFAVRSQFDPKAPQRSQVGIDIELGSASMNPDADAELPKPEWFHAAKFPKASFQSTSIRTTGPGRFEATGQLSIKGQMRPVVVPVQITQSQGLSTASGQFKLKRLDFKVGDGDWRDTSVVADEVEVRFKFVLRNLPPL
jgi:polyisoprenoid-binding protein YceI